MDDEASGEVEAVGHHRLAGRALADGPAGRLQAFGAGGAVDGTVDPAAPEQPAVRRVDDRVDPLGGDVTQGRLEQRRHAAYPAVVEVAPDVALGTSLSSDSDFPGAFSFVASPQCEKLTVPWMAEEPPAPPGLVTS